MNKIKDMEAPAVYKNYFERYTALVPEKSVSEALNNQEKVLNDFLNKVSEDKSNYAYAEGKWTLKELLQHLTDTERIFTYRALAIARKDSANLPGYDENLYADNSAANNRSWKSLTEEFSAVRVSTKCLFTSFTQDMLIAEGTFNSNKGSVDTLGLIIAGHVYHHIKIGEERYF